MSSCITYDSSSSGLVTPLTTTILTPISLKKEQTTQNESFAKQETEKSKSILSVCGSLKRKTQRTAAAKNIQKTSSVESRTPHTSAIMSALIDHTRSNMSFNLEHESNLYEEFIQNQLASSRSNVLTGLDELKVKIYYL